MAAVPPPSDVLEVACIPVLSDNYIWLLREPGSGRTAVVDPAEAAPVMAELEKRWVTPGWSRTVR